jgi:hypothetical protein
MVNRLESFLNDEFANKKGTNGIQVNSLLLSNAKRLSHACPNPGCPWGSSKVSG